MAPSSVSTASAVLEGPVTLPLSKFSYCTIPDPQAKMTWTHLRQRSDMFAVFDVIRKISIGMVVLEMKVLRLFRGGELLEHIEFTDLRDQVRLDEECAQHQQIPDSDLRVLVIVKEHLLALRYTLPDGLIRKIQMKFILRSACDVALETFRTAGLPIRDENPQVQAQHPQSSQSQPRSQNRPGSINAGQFQRLQSSQSQPNSQERPGSLNASQPDPPKSLHGAFSDTSRSLQQERTRVSNTGHVRIPPSAQSTGDNIRPLSAPVGVNQDDFSRPILISYRSTLDASGSTKAVPALPIGAEPRPKSGLLPSPVGEITSSPDPLALSSPPLLEMRAEKPSSKPPALPSINSRKRSLTDQSANHPRKRELQTMSNITIKTTTETMTEDLIADIPECQHREELPEATDPLIPTAVNTRHQGLLDSIDNKLRQFRDITTPKSGPQTGKDQLAEYAAQSDDNAKILDSFICECIKNDDFWELMDDIERSWKRIGLGLGFCERKEGAEKK